MSNPYTTVNPRVAIWRYLVRVGGSFEDPSGKLPGKLTRALGWVDDEKGRSRVSTALRNLEKGGHALREHRGSASRLYGVVVDPSNPPPEGPKIKIPLASPAEPEALHVQPTPEPEPEPEPDLPDGVDYNRLALQMLVRAADAISAAQEQRRQVREYEASHASQQRTVTRLQAELTEARRQVEQMRGQVEECRRQIAARDRRGAAVRDQLDDATRNRLDRMMTELPNGH